MTKRALGLDDLETVSGGAVPITVSQYQPGHQNLQNFVNQWNEFKFLEDFERPTWNAYANFAAIKENTPRDIVDSRLVEDLRVPYLNAVLDGRQPVSSDSFAPVTPLAEGGDYVPSYAAGAQSSAPSSSGYEPSGMDLESNPFAEQEQPYDAGDDGSEGVAYGGF